MSKIKDLETLAQNLVENEYQNYRHWDGLFYSFIKQMEKGKVISKEDIQQVKDAMFKKQERFCKQANQLKEEIDKLKK